MARFLVVLSILAGVVATISWQWSTITGLYGHMDSKPQTQAGHETPLAQPKLSGRLPQEQSAGQAPGTSAPSAQTTPAVARVVFYEEDPNDQQGRRYVGSAIWRTETVSPAFARRSRPSRASSSGTIANIDVMEQPICSCSSTSIGLGAR